MEDTGNTFYNIFGVAGIVDELLGKEAIVRNSQIGEVDTTDRGITSAAVLCPVSGIILPRKG